MTDNNDTASDDDIDLARFLIEARHALHEAFVLPQAVDPGLYAKPDPDHDRVELTDRHGTHLAWLPLHRLRRPDPERLRRAAEAVIAQLPTALGDQVAAAVNAGAMTVHEPPDSDYVTVDAHLGARTLPLFAAHRRAVVAGYPPLTGDE